MSSRNLKSMFIDYALGTGSLFSLKAKIIAAKPWTLKEDEKVKIDHDVVWAIAAKHKVTPHESERGKLSCLTLGSGSEAPGQALSRMRAVLLMKNPKSKATTAAHTDVVKQMAKYASSMRKKHGMTRKQAERAVAQAFAE